VQLADLKNMNYCRFDKCFLITDLKHCFLNNLSLVTQKFVNQNVLESSSHYLSVEIGLMCFGCSEQKLHAFLV
jgi:hypothetical protein